MNNKVEEVGELNKRMAQLLGRDTEKEKKGILLIFPEEIWEKIFASLTDGMDLWNCYRACPLFGRILEPDVAPLMSNYIFYEFSPYIYKHLSRNQILKCRRVSKTWSAGVDNLFENHKSLRPHQDGKGGPLNQPFVTPMQEKGLGLWFTNTKGGPKFFGKYDRRPQRASGKPSILHSVLLEEEIGLGVPRTRNPFIGRELILDYSLQLPELETLLEKFGKHIWYLTVTIYGTSWEPGLLKLVTVDQARLLPNLRSLRIVGFTSIRPVPVEPVTLAPTLETLQIDGAFSPTFSTPMAVALLEKYHTQLGRLHVGAKDWEKVAHLGWPKLKELHVDELGSFQAIFQAKMPILSKFGIKPEHTFHPNGSQLLANINKLSASTPLSTLHFSRDVPDILSENPKTMGQAHPQLKTLEMEHYRFPNMATSYDFLTNFPFLENLHIFWGKPVKNKEQQFECHPKIQLRSKREYDQELQVGRGRGRGRGRVHLEKFDVMDEVEVVQVHKFVYQGEMYKSNIWGLLTHLKLLTFQGDIYTREGYQRFREWEGSAN